MKLLTLGWHSPKTLKSDNAGLGYLSAIMYLAPSKLSGYNVCPHATPGCIAACLNTAGRGKCNGTQQARIRRTKLWFENRPEFKSKLMTEIKSFIKRCTKREQKPCIRLNGTSDIAWERVWPEVLTTFPEVQFYDYTKSMQRAIQFAYGKMPANYHLTFSRSETNDIDCQIVLSSGCNVAVVFSSKDIPQEWNGFPVHNADETDLRFLDKYGVQGLYAKGRANQDNSGFVVKV